MPAETPEECDDSILIRLENVGKRYGDFWAVRSVTLRVRRGESVGIIGLNGAGKSTLLQLIAGALPPSEGKVQVFGRIAMLLQLGMGFDEDFTGLENLYLSASLHGLSQKVINAGLAEIEQFAEIGSFLYKPVRTYSSGMKLRLAFALLTQLEPDIIVIDEALSVGDAYFSHKCARLLHKLRDDGKSLLFVSHDPGAVKTYCDRAVLLEKGLLVRDGSPIDVLDYYNAIIALKEKERESIGDGIVVSNGRQIRSGNGSAIIARWDLLDSQGKAVRAVLCGAEATIACYIEFTQDVSSPTVGFLIRDRLGNHVFGTNTSNLGLHTRLYKQGEGVEFAFSLPLTLGPGSYSITIAVHAGRDHREGNFDWRDNLISFSVVPNWPFSFTGVAALPVSVKLTAKPKLLSCQIEWDQEIGFSVDGTGHRYTESGWAYPEEDFCWTLGKKSLLVVLLPEPTDCKMVVDIIPWLTPNIHTQTVVIQANEQVLTTWHVDHPGRYETFIPASIYSAREMRLTIVLPDACSPMDAGVSDDARELAIAFRSAKFMRT